MTWSLIALDPATGLHGIIIASRFFAVGAICPCTKAGVGAVSSQALPNPSLGPWALALMGEGLGAATARDMLVRADRGIDQRQIHMVDRDGGTAAFTGAECVDWCGHRSGDGVSLAGNMLAGAQVLDETLAVYEANADLHFCDRLLAAMDAGEAAGGDKRGKQSSALRIQGAEPYPRLDLRVDDHPDPLVELRRLYGVAKERFLPFSRAYPTAERPYGITDRAEIEALVERHAGEPLETVVPLPNRFLR